MVDFTISEIEAICKRLVRHGGTPIRPMGVPFLDERIEEYEDKYKGGHAYYSVLREIARVLQPKVVVEIGTWEGTSAACFASGAPEAEVITMDHHGDDGDKKNLERTLNACKVYKNLSYINGCSNKAVHDVKPGTRFALPDFIQVLGDRKIDILFIDGWHVYEYAKADFDTYKEFLADTALVICDDLLPGDHVTIEGLDRFWAEIPGEKYLDGAIHAGFPVGFSKVVKG